MLALSLIYYTRKSLNIAPVSLLISFIPYIMVYFTTLIVATFSITSKPIQLISITSCQLGSLEFLALIIYSKVISNPTIPLLTIPLLAATNAYNYIRAKGVFSYTYKDQIAFQSSAFYFLRLYYSNLISTRLFLMLLILLYYTIVSLRLLISR